jgi:diguanylate cyclase (GGDEF)-like protein/PAS domain S-box-containing protein
MNPFSRLKHLHSAILAVVLASLFLPALGAGTYLLWIKAPHEVYQRLDEHLASRVEILAMGMQEPLWTRNPANGENLLDSLFTSPHVASLTVTDSNQQVFLKRERSDPSQGRLFSMERPVLHGDNPVGMVQVMVHDGASQQELAGERKTFMILLGGQLLLSVVLLVWLLRSRFMTPLQGIITAVEEMEQGNLERPLALHRADELGVLTRHLDKMRQSLAKLFRQLRKNEEQFRLLTENLPGTVYMCLNNERWTMLYISDRIKDLTGYSKEDFLHDRISFADLYHPDDRSRIYSTTEEAASFHLEYRIRHRHGHWRWVEEKGTFIRRDGEPPYLEGYLQDITERKLSENELRLNAAVFENTLEGVIITDAQTQIVAVNRSFSRITGYGEDEMINNTPRVLRSGRQDKAFYEQMWSELKTAGHWAGEIWNRRKNGEIYPEWLTISAVNNDQGELTHYVGVFTDITPLKESQDQLQHLAHHDPLTGLPNRLLFNDRLSQCIQRARRNESQLAILFVDLDHFKDVNDTLGHHLGDELLRRVAQQLAACVRGMDTIARLGGDEFTALLENVDARGASAVADKLLAAFAQPFTIAEHELYVSASVGISLFPADGEDPESLLKNADTAMYQSKLHGRNRYHFYAQEMTAHFLERLRMERQLRGTIERGELRVYYQPQVAAASGRLLGVEALVRWQHPEQGLVSPVRFIPLAEETGFISQLGEWVLRASCEQIKAWRNAGFEVPRVAVNLSPRQIERSQTVTAVRDILRETGIPPDWLELEITESGLVDSAQCYETISGLQDLGISLAVDDFGTGYSSLSYLKRLPISKLKIDRSFVQDVPGDPNGTAITIAIIQMARSLGLSVLAEGVETRAQEDFLLYHGCLDSQGFLYGRPMPAEELQAAWSGQGQRAH